MDPLWGLIDRTPSFIYRRSLDLLEIGSQVNPAEFINKSIKKRGTLTDFVHAWTIRASTMNCSNCGSFHLKAEPSARSKMVFNSKLHCSNCILVYLVPGLYSLYLFIEQGRVSLVYKCVRIKSYYAQFLNGATTQPSCITMT